jgi:hypothetical protein
MIDVLLIYYSYILKEYNSIGFLNKNKAKISSGIIFLNENNIFKDNYILYFLHPKYAR